MNELQRIKEKALKKFDKESSYDGSISDPETWKGKLLSDDCYPESFYELDINKTRDFIGLLIEKACKEYAEAIIPNHKKTDSLEYTSGYGDCIFDMLDNLESHE